MDLLAVVVAVALACVSGPDGTSCRRSASGCTSHLPGRWCRSCQCRSCKSPLCIFWPCVLAVHISNKHLLHAFLLILFLLVGCCSIHCLFLVAVSFSFAISLLSFERLLIVSAFSSFVVVVAVVVPVVPVAFAFVALSFALAFAFLSFVFVVPRCSCAGPWLLLPDAIACSLVNVAVAL